MAKSSMPEHIPPNKQGNFECNTKRGLEGGLNPFVYRDNRDLLPGSGQCQLPKSIQIVCKWGMKLQLSSNNVSNALGCNQSIIISNSIQSITQFQQMPSKAQGPLFLILRQIKRILKEFSLRNGGDGVNLHEWIATLTEQLQATNICSQKIVKLMIASQESQQQIKGALWRHLRKAREQGQIMQEYEQLKKENRQSYSIANSNLNTLIKEILENVKLIEDELLNLNHNVNLLKNEITQADTPSPAVNSLSLYLLLKIVMGDTNITFSENMNEFLFRMYILEESISLIFVKTQKVFEEITDTLNEENASRRSSYNSEKTGKRSALSESIEIFKRNQLRQELERNDLLNEQTREGRKESIIQSDYKMIRKTEKKVAKTDNRAACCFRF